MPNGQRHRRTIYVTIFFLLGGLLSGEGAALCQAQQDSVKLSFGDPTNTDIPAWYPAFSLSRFARSPQQPRSNVPMPMGYGSSTSVDSLIKSIRVGEQAFGVPVGTEYTLDLDSYLNVRRSELATKHWDSVVSKYELKRPMSSGEINALIDQASNIVIPIPPNPIMSIFGKPEIAINVNGEVNVQAGWRWDTQNLGTASVFGQTQSGPIFNQNIQVNVSARIGDKFKFNVDWNTLNQFEFNNRFKVGYDGYDDDIVKKVELGNVNLETQSTLIGGGQSLFGVRADFQFGPLFLKTIASQRRGERRFINAQGGAARQFFAIRAYDYARNHFFLDTNYFAIWRQYFKSATPVIPPAAAPLAIKELEVWESTNDLRDVQANDAVAIDTLPPILWAQGARYPDAIKRSVIAAGNTEQGRFIRLDPKRYEYDQNLGKVTILNLRNDRTYAVSYRIEGETESNTDDLYYGTLSTTAKEKDTLILKLIARPQMQPGFRTIWKRQMRNIYSLGLSNVNPQDARIGLWYFRNTNDSGDVLQGAPDKLVTIFRLDQVNNGTGSAPPDGVLDSRPPIFNATRGEITFPSLEPFRDGLREYFASKGSPELAEQYVFNEVYDTTEFTARLNSAKDRFVITGEAAGTASGSRIPLAYNVAPGSVRVRLDGVDLREGSDYTVDYYTGSVNLLNARALLPGANLNVEYEQNDMFNVTTRTLVGLRADYTLFNKRKITGKLGMTLMNYDQAAIIDRVVPGQEPNSNFMMGFDARFDAELPWLTRALDALPLYSTKEKSTLKVIGEWASVSPTPNKRFSVVCSDNGAAVAYVDDFEAARRYISFGLTPSVWSQASPSVDQTLWVDDTTAQRFRGRSFWYQYFIPRTPQRDVYPNRFEVQGRRNINDLRITFDPNIRGIYNTNEQFVDSLTPAWKGPDSSFVRGQAAVFQQENREKIWGGMMRLLSPFNTNFDNENIDYIDIMMYIENYEPGSKMFIDLGQISEDVIPNRALNTEDAPPPNNLIDVGEDRGLDTLTNDREKATYPFPLNEEADPARDDYAFNFGKNPEEQVEEDFIKYNNAEGNATQAETGQYPDTEILNKNNGQTILLDNSYFRYQVRLDPNPATNPQIVGGNPASGWYLYRIPVRKPDFTVGNPLYTNIQYIRVHFQGGAVKLRIADWGLTGSFWLRKNSLQSGVPENDSTLRVAYVNREENAGPPDYYTMPPCVQPPQQLQNPDPRQQAYLNEQSLVVGVNSLRPAEERMAARILRSMDMFYYQQIAFFIHGDQTMPDKVAPGATAPAYAYFRFGVDSVNYYEYRRPLLRGWQDIHIKMGDLTAIKEIRDNSRQYERQAFPVPGDDQAQFVIMGNPIITRVQFVGFGIANPAERYPNELTTTMWVDELRILEPIDNNDYAALGTVDLRLADLAQITATANQSTPNFHRLEERFGNRLNSSSFNVTVTSGLEKLLPKEYQQTRIPVTYSHTEYAETPLFQVNNDVRLEAAAEAARQDTLANGATQAEADQAADNVRNRSQTVRVQDAFSITGFKLGLPSKDWYINDVVNRLQVSYNYTQEFLRNQISSQKFDWRWNLKLDYNVTLSNKFNVMPFGFLGSVGPLSVYKDSKINYLPSSLTLGWNMWRRRITEQSRFLTFASPVIREFNSEAIGAFNWKLVENGFLSPIIDYRVTSASTLVPLELDANGRQRTGADVASQVFFGGGGLNMGSPNNYTQTMTISMRPRMPDIVGLSRLLETTMSYTSSYTWFDPLQPDPALRDAVKVASYNTQMRLNPVLRWRQIGQEMFGPPIKSPQGFYQQFASIVRDIFFGFDNLTFSYTQNNKSTNPGVMGGTGFTNFWARSMTLRPNDPMWGPSTAYQLGLVPDPHGSFDIEGSSVFPFFRFTTDVGLRPPNTIVQDDYFQKNTFQFQTSRPLWPGATLDLIMKTDWGYTRNQRVITDAAGVPTFSNVSKRLTLERTFISFPYAFFSDDEIDQVIRLYDQRKATILADPDTTFQSQQLLDALSTSFREGFESWQLWTGELARVMPALNWSIRWDGIEKFSLFKGLAQRIFLEHSYQSTYTENARITDNGRLIDVQQIGAGFQPLIGLNASFDERKVGGLLTATARYNTRTVHTLNTSARSTISRETQNELQLQASFLKRNFSLEFLGINLQNDAEFIFLFQLRQSRRATYNVLQPNEQDGSLVDGTTLITIEPRARYTISNRVTASAFIRYEGNVSEGAAQPGFSTTQVGVDIRLSISGGR